MAVTPQPVLSSPCRDVFRLVKLALLFNSRSEAVLRLLADGCCSFSVLALCARVYQQCCMSEAVLCRCSWARLTGILSLMPLSCRPNNCRVRSTALYARFCSYMHCQEMVLALHSLQKLKSCKGHALLIHSNLTLQHRAPPCKKFAATVQQLDHMALHTHSSVQHMICRHTRLDLI